MKPFVRESGVAVSLWRSNVDTDAIIPIEYCVNRKRPHFGEGLFHRWRFETTGEVRDFPLNEERHRDPVVLVAGENFGCGSSREMAVWALADFGFRCVIAPSFGEIFFSNCFQNGVLPIRLPVDQVAELAEELAAAPEPRLTVDLQDRRVETAAGDKLNFSVNELRRQALLQGLDPVSATLTRASAIDDFQQRDRETRPWIYREETR